jgi:hypothetical protein
MRSLVDPVAVETLPTLNTMQLMALRKRLLACEERVEDSDLSSNEIELLESSAATPIRFKQDPRWEVLYRAVRAVLDTREQIPGGDQRRSDRQVRAKLQKTYDRGGGR